MTDALTYVSICAGAGLGSAGFDRAGWTGVAFVERDPIRRRVLRLHHPDALLLSDLRSVTAADVPRTDAWIVTVPCKSFSRAGSRKGLGDANGDLHRVFLRLLADSVRRGSAPAVIVWENVDDWFGSPARRLVQRALGRFGYPAVVGRVLNARRYGVPQDRCRAYMVFARDPGLLPEAMTPPAVSDPLVLEDSLTREWPEAFVHSDLSDGDRTRLVRRVAGKAQGTRHRLVEEARRFVGELPAPPEWERYCVLHNTNCPTSFGVGYSPTLMTGTRLAVRLPGGRLVWACPEGYEWLMAANQGYTSTGVDERGRQVRLSRTARTSACGDGIVVPVMQAIANAVGERLRRR